MKKQTHEFSKFYVEYDLLIYYTVELIEEDGTMKIMGRIHRPLFHPLVNQTKPFGREREIESLLLAVEDYIPEWMADILEGRIFFATGEIPN